MVLQSREKQTTQKTETPPAGQDSVISGDTSPPDFSEIRRMAFSPENAADGKVDMKKVAQAVEDIETAANRGVTGRLGTDEDKLWDTIFRLSKEEFVAVNKMFLDKYGKDRGKRGETWDVLRELEDELGGSDLSRIRKLIGDKFSNEVPKEFRVTGESLLKPDSNLKVGEMNTIKLPDGRQYDVYIPRNADSRAPVVMALHGVSFGGTGHGTMASESGLVHDAEKTGSIVVFPLPKERTFKTSVVDTPGASWNVPGQGRKDLSKQEDETYDDRVYLDNVLDDLGRRSKMAQKVGMLGFSDGGRMAQVYAADRPERVAGVVSIHGTWMEGDDKPKNGVPIMIVHGAEDQTLPYNGGFGSTSEKMHWYVKTNIEHSKPFMQAKVWSEANGITGEARVETRGDVEMRTYAGKNGNVVKEYIIKGADHGLHDYKNDGSRFIQWLLGKPDLKRNVSLGGTQFLKGYIVRDLESTARK